MRVLVIEDDPDTQENLRDILELDGAAVDAALSVQEALSRGDWSQYTAILLDRKLPDGSAEDWLPRIVQLAPEAAVIIVTGHADMDVTIEALRQGVSDFLLKPVDADALRASMIRAEKLKQAQRRALQAERLAAIGQMMTVLTHESRNAFQRLQGNLEMLQGEIGDRPGALQFAARAIKAQADLHRLFQDVREYAGPMQLELESCDLGQILQCAWSQLGAQRHNRSIQLTAETNGVNLECRADCFRLEQVFRNLLENALAACPDPVELRVSWSHVQLGGQGAVRFVLQDNGPGLSLEVRERLFEPFFTTRSKGTGLGMSIAKRIVESHGGRIVAANNGSGAEFVITLPQKFRESDVLEREKPDACPQP
jgi:signal transduction histidine kinase